MAEPSAVGVAVVTEPVDVVTSAGLRALLRGPQTVVVDTPGEAQVAVLAASDVDEQTLLIAKELRRTHDVRLVLLVDTIAEGPLLAVVELGLSGLLLRREVTGASLCRAVVGAASGDATMPPHALGRLLLAIERRASAVGADRVGLSGLSDREVEVLRLVAEGYDTAAVADALNYSPRTIKSVITGVMARLGLRNRTHVIAHVVREGLI